MVSQLKKSAICPICGDPLLALSDLTTSTNITRAYFHGKRPDAARRRGAHIRVFTDHEEANRERKALEV